MVLQAFCGMLRLAEPAGLNKKSRNITSVRYENWRQPTLAQARQALPSARLCLTAEFGMGSGRTTALWPPKIVLVNGSSSGVSGLTIVRQTRTKITKSNSILRGQLTTDNSGHSLK